MNRKKFIFIFVILILSIFLFKTVDVIAGGSWDTAYAYQLTILKYDGTGSPQKVGSPILIYHSDLFATVTKVYGTDLPSSYNQLMNTRYDIYQMIDVNSKNASWSNDVENVFGSPNLKRRPETDRFGKEVPMCGSGVTGYCTPGTIWYETNMMNDNFSCGATVAKSGVKTADRTTGTTSWVNYTFRYMTNHRTVTYYGKDVVTSQYHAIYKDDNLTESNVKNNNYLDNIVKNKYCKSRQSIKQYFGVDIDYKDIDKYYVSAEPVHRVLETSLSKFNNTGSYEVKTLEYVQEKRRKYTIDGSCDSSEYVCSTWQLEKNPYNCSCGKKNCTDYGSWGKYSCSSYSSSTSTRKCKADSSCVSGHSCKTRSSWSVDCMNCKCPDTYSLVEQKCGVRQLHILYGMYATGPSYLVTSKNNRAINLCSTEDNKHCVLDENNNCTNVYEYYIGPDQERALVGTGKVRDNKYYLSGSCSKKEAQKGIKHYYLENLVDCANSCESAGSKKSDEYLKCAENYCDAEVDFDLKGNARIRKKNCILSCGYTYGKDPDTGSETSPKRESVDSCGNSNPYKNKDKYVSNSESTCSTSNTKYVPMREEKAVITSCQGDNVTDFDNNDTNDTIFDLRTYINIACKEESSFDFLDTSKLYLTAGQGIEYLTQLLGERECTVYFNLEQWKFDYASISAKDPDRRKRLNYVYTVFNNILDESYDKTKNKYYDPDFLAEHMGEVDWDTGQFIYNKDKVSVRSKVTEIINNKVEEKATEELKNTNYTTKTNQNVWFKNSSDKNKSKVTKITKMKLTQDSVNKYISTSKVEAEYMFKDSCVTTDGESKVYSPTSGVCYELKTGETTKKILPKNVYYTSLMATPNSKFNETIIKQKKTHNIETNTSVGRDIKEEQVYYDNKEKCEYKIQDQNLMCKIVIDSTGATKLGNDIYEGESVTAKVWAEEELEKDDGIESVSITVNGKTYDGNSRNISIEKATDSNEKFEIEGTVITKKGAVVNCPKTIHILRHPPSCGVSCSINKINDKLYEIVSTGRTTPTNYYRSLSTNMTKVEVFPSFADKKYYVRLDSSLEDVTTRHIYNANILFGYVYSSRCNDYCRTPFNDLPDCEEKYKASKTGDIREYCETYYQDDINNYESVEDCVIRCSSVRECPENRRDIKEVTSFCQANYSKAGYKDADLCVNRCYYCPECDSSEYVFRPISNSDPFPNSEESVIPGNRLIGKNWYSLSKYITKDDEDHTSVTGDFANMNVEYIIDLNPQKIKKIRLDSLEKGVSIYSAYVYTSTTEKNAVTRYKSSFIHEDFKEYFKDSLVSGGKTIIALPDE